MAKATSKAGYGSGWHKQSGRHSMARKTGRAGGNYANTLARMNNLQNKKNDFFNITKKDVNDVMIVEKARISTENEDDADFYSKLKDKLESGKSLTSREKLVLRSLKKDSDGDGVPDSKDCDPHNPYKQDHVKSFDIGDGYEIVAEWKNTRNGFKHEAVLLHNGEEIDRGKINYQNRTWESYEYQSIVDKLIDKNFANENERKRMKGLAEGKSREELDKMMKTTVMVAKMGDFFGKDQKEKNDWKKRMLKAGVKGLDIPDDFDNLPEAEKEKRLNAVISEMSKERKKKDNSY